MKTKLKRAISFILALVTLMGAFPVSPALAADDGMAPLSALYDKDGKVGDVSSDYLSRLEYERKHSAPVPEDMMVKNQLNLSLATAD